MMPPFEMVTTRATGKAIRNPDGRAMRRMEREFEAAVGRALGTLRLELVRGIDADPGEMIRRLDDERITRPFQDAIARQVERVALAGAGFGREQVEREVFGVGRKNGSKAAEVGMWELANNAAAQWAVRYGYELVRGLLATTRDWLRLQVAEYVRNSETIGQLTARIREGSGFGADRARRIAVTEVTRAFARGNMESWRASGVIEGKEWRTNNDELVCPVCGPLAGRMVGLDESFATASGDIEGPPSHPGCRCWLVPAPVRSPAEVLREAFAAPERGIGITYNAYTGDVAREGLVFAPRKDTERALSGADSARLMAEFKRYWRDNGDLLRTRQGAEAGNHFGLWYNSGDGKYYFDVSVVQPRSAIRDVIRRADEADQKAFYDLGSGTEINTATAMSVLERMSDAPAEELLRALGIGD